MKKIIITSVAAILAMSLSITVFAAESFTGKVTRIEGERITILVDGPVPAWARPPWEMSPARLVVPVLLTVRVRVAPPRSTAPPRVRLQVPPPAIVKLPPTLTSLLRVRVPLACRVPPLMVKVPVPKAESLPAIRVPAESVVPPV